VKRSRVLLVDDDEGVRTALDSLLRSFDFDIVGTAADGHAALAEAARLTPDVVMLDITMPVLNGLKALPGLRICLPRAAIIVLTCHEDPNYPDEALRLGADAFVLKRRVPYELIPAIEGALTIRKMRTPHPE
jgi:DNA-binding NarL/FixJ family response regulator